MQVVRGSQQTIAAAWVRWFSSLGNCSRAEAILPPQHHRDLDLSQAIVRSRAVAAPGHARQAASLRLREKLFDDGSELLRLVMMHHVAAVLDDDFAEIPECRFALGKLRRAVG